MESEERRGRWLGWLIWGAIVVCLVGLITLIPGRIRPRVYCRTQCTSVEFETCSVCGSTRSIARGGVSKKVKTDYKAPGYATCGHRWKSGITDLIHPPVPDGQIVLVKKGKALGAVILSNQCIEPEFASFDWYCRTDGKGSFGRSATGVVLKGSGHSVKSSGRPGSELRFSTFKVLWTGSGNGKGFICYPHFPGGAAQPDDTLVCPTKETDIEKIDATDPKWVYKASVGDPGCFGSAP